MEHIQPETESSGVVVHPKPSTPQSTSSGHEAAVEHIQPETELPVQTNISSSFPVPTLVASTEAFAVGPVLDTARETKPMMPKKEPVSATYTMATPVSLLRKMIPGVIDLTADTDDEEDERNVPLPIMADTALPGTSTGVSPIPIGRQAATDLLQSLTILDDSNVQALLDAGFKSRESFLSRLPLMDEDDKIAILGELRRDMGKIDYSECSPSSESYMPPRAEITHS